jgi:hypothetical protein
MQMVRVRVGASEVEMREGVMVVFEESERADSKAPTTMSG